MRKDNNSDRVFDVIGAPEKFYDDILAAINDKFNPAWAFIVASQNDYARFKAYVEQVRPELKERLWAGWKSSASEDSKETAFCFESEECANVFIETVYCKNRPRTENGDPWDGRVKVLILINQTGRERFLHEVIGNCAPFGLKTYRVTTATAGQADSLSICTNLPGWEGIPLSVDLTAKAAGDEEIPAIPDDAMYGQVCKIARQTQTPMGYAYSVGLAAASVLVESDNFNVRTNLYVAPTGDVHSGKSLAASRTFQLYGLENEMGQPTRDELVICTAASDRGLYRIIGEDRVKRLIYEDEGRAMLGKGNIQGSQLIPALCCLFNRNYAGVGDKLGVNRMNVCLSLLMNLKMRDPSEFPEVFTHATSHGFWDRIIFGSRGTEKWHYTAWDFETARDVFVITPSTPRVPVRCSEATERWSKEGVDRDRLAEIALRVAFITSAMNGEEQVSDAAVNAALRFMEWQEKIRAVYQPAKGSNEAEECMKTVIAAFTKENGYSYNFRDMAWRKHWYEKFAKTLLSVKKLLIAERVIGLDKESNKHYLIKEKVQ